MQKILAIESSCDDTSVAIINTKYQILAMHTSSQKEHLQFGGVLPELASRLHMKNIMYLVEHVLTDARLTKEDISAIAVSINPGLIGSLIVGLSFAKSLAWSLQIPCITVNHMLAHVFANYIEHEGIETPFLALIVSGGHTELVYFRDENNFVVVGKTLDDAAGETFDKAAKLMHLGYPGGPVIDKLAQSGDAELVKFPIGMKQKDNFNFSFSGLKTAILQFLSKQDPEWINKHTADLSASVQQAIITPLVNKTIRYCRLHQIKRILVAGGVAANTGLRHELAVNAQKIGAEVYFPSIRLCMDNAAMVGAAAIPKFNRKLYSNLDVNAFSEKGIRLL